MSDGRRAAASRGNPKSVRPIVQPPDLGSADRIDAYVGRRLRARRMEIGLSQGALGRQLGVTFSQVQKYEKGANRLGAGRLYQAAALLGVPVEYFFEGFDKPGGSLLKRRDVIAEAEVEQLHQAFIRISDRNARQALLSLASTMVNRA